MTHVHADIGLTRNTLRRVSPETSFESHFSTTVPLTDWYAIGFDPKVTIDGRMRIVEPTSIVSTEGRLRWDSNTRCLSVRYILDVCNEEPPTAIQIATHWIDCGGPINVIHLKSCSPRGGRATSEVQFGYVDGPRQFVPRSLQIPGSLAAHMITSSADVFLNRHVLGKPAQGIIPGMYPGDVEFAIMEPNV